MAVTPRPRISEIAPSGVPAVVSRVSSSPLGRNVSHDASMAVRADRTSGSRTTSLRILGSKETVPPLPFTTSMALVVISMISGREKRRPGHVQVTALFEQLRHGFGPAHLSAGTVLYVVDKIALAIVAVAHEGAPRGEGRADLDGADVHPVVTQPPQVDPAEVVVADAADDAAGLAELGDLVDEDGRSAARERPHQADRLAEPLSPVFRHDLDQDLAESHDLGHLHLYPGPLLAIRRA